MLNHILVGRKSHNKRIKVQPQAAWTSTASLVFAAYRYAATKTTNYVTAPYGGRYGYSKVIRLA